MHLAQSRPSAKTTFGDVGAELPATLSTAANLASALSYQGKYADAERIEREVLVTMKRVRGVDHPETQEDSVVRGRLRGLFSPCSFAATCPLVGYVVFRDLIFPCTIQQTCLSRCWSKWGPIPGAGPVSPVW